MKDEINLDDLFPGIGVNDNEIHNNDFICSDCAKNKFGKNNVNRMATWHMGKCSICKNDNYLTQLRDFY